MVDDLWPGGYQLHHFEEIDSTNAAAKRRFDDGDKGPFWVVADRQTSGRGSRGRPWQTFQGNLFASLLIVPDFPPRNAAQLSFVACLAVLDTLREFMHDEEEQEISLKWPNDVLVNGRKISGVLLESGTDAKGGMDWLVIGIGINLVDFPDGTPYPATSVRHECGKTPETIEAIIRLANHVDRYLTQWKREGFGPIRDTWVSYAHGLGGPLKVKLGEDEQLGLFDSLDETGALMLNTPDGMKRILTGDIFFPPKRN